MSARKMRKLCRQFREGHLLVAEVMRIMGEKASHGETQMSITVPSGVDVGKVEKMLLRKGFTVSVAANRLSVGF